jgi:hypothetical protein
MIISYLNEDIEAVKKYYKNIDDDTFMDLIALDPTYRGKDSLGKYGKWILNLFNKGAISKNDFDDVTDILNQFTTYRNRIKNKDLNAYKSLDELGDVLASVIDDDSMLSDRQKLRFKKNAKAGRIKTGKEDDYDVVFEDDKFIVFVPHTHEASMQLAKGSHWCTSHEDPKYYNKYTADGQELYIVKNKKTGERYQYGTINGDFYNESDKPFDYYKELFLKDENLLKFMSKLDRHFTTDVYDVLNTMDKDGYFIIGGKKEYDCLFDPYIRNMIKKIRVPDGTKKLSSCSGLNSLEEIIIPDSVTEIPDSCFTYCEKLCKVVMPTYCKLGRFIFQDCTSLKEIHIKNASLSEMTFYNSSLERISFTGSVEDFPNFCFNDNLKYIEFKKNINKLGKYVLSYKPKLEKVIFHGSVDLIEDDAFKGDKKLTIYTDSDYVKEYADENGIKVEPLSKAKNESLKRNRILKLRIREY